MPKENATAFTINIGRSILRIMVNSRNITKKNKPEVNKKGAGFSKNHTQASFKLFRTTHSTKRVRNSEEKIIIRTLMMAVYLFLINFSIWSNKTYTSLLVFVANVYGVGNFSGIVRWGNALYLFENS